MVTIGVYDSGIGGLTTLCELKNAIPNADFYFLADNKNMPFGLKTDDELETIVYHGIKKLEAHSDCSVLACNTASITTNSLEVFKLLPNLKNLNPEKTLVLATPLTMTHLKAKEIFFNSADTRELATMIEIQASLNFKQRTEIDMSALLPYLKLKLADFKGVESVVLGCSHYIYLKKEIAKILGEVQFFDGNQQLASTVKDFVSESGGTGKITFDFTGTNENNKYAYIFEKLQKALFLRG